jgi:hypothetical protein
MNLEQSAEFDELQAVWHDVTPPGWPKSRSKDQIATLVCALLWEAPNHAWRADPGGVWLLTSAPRGDSAAIAAQAARIRAVVAAVFREPDVRVPPRDCLPDPIPLPNGV